MELASIVARLRCTPLLNHILFNDGHSFVSCEITSECVIIEFFVVVQIMNSTSLAGNTTSGWVPQNGGRGMFDILSTCIFTIFLCCWTSVCVNVPAATDTKRDRFLHKAKLASVGILGPDFLLILAIGQYESARRSVSVSVPP